LHPVKLNSFKLEILGKFCTANPDNYTEESFNHLKLIRKYFGTQSATSMQALSQRPPAKRVAWILPL
jgi:hypothetical protein